MTRKRKQRKKNAKERAPSFPPPIKVEGAVRDCCRQLVKLLATLEKKESFYRDLRQQVQGWLSDLVRREL